MSSRSLLAAAGRLLLASAAAVSWVEGLAGEAAVEPLLARLKAVGPEGAGNPEASAAARELAARGPDSLLPVLRAMDGAGPAARNWLRASFEAVAERALQKNLPLPAKDLEAFVLERGRAGPVRRLAYEWLVKVDSSAPDRLIPSMLDDPSVEMRRDAVARELTLAQKLLDQKDNAAALAAHQKLLPFSRDRDQVELIAKRLEGLGVKVDLTRHFGWIQGWRLIGPFDNTAKSGYGAVYPPEERLDFAAAYPGKGSAVRWAAHQTADAYGVVDLNKALGKHMGVVAYAAAEVESAVEQPVHVRTGSPNAVKIWLNGKLLFTRDEYHHAFNVDQYQAAGALEAGRNTILIKVCQNEQTEDWAQEWKFQLRVCDPTGGGVR